MWEDPTEEHQWAFAFKKDSVKKKKKVVLCMPIKVLEIPKEVKKNSYHRRTSNPCRFKEQKDSRVKNSVLSNMSNCVLQTGVSMLEVPVETRVMIPLVWSMFHFYVHYKGSL